MENKKMSTVSIMRGPSGSGKSTHAKMIKNSLDNVEIVSADDFFMVDGKYVYDVKMIGEYH